MVAQDRLWAERSLAETEIRFRNMADNAPVMIWVTDPAGKCVYLNARWYQFTGQQSEQALGMGWTDATHPDDKERVTAAFLKANAAQGPFCVEYRLRRGDDTYRWVLDAAAARFSESGRYLGYVGSVIDIHDRREAELRLQVSESRFRAAVGAVQGVLWTNSAAGEMVGEQPGWGALTGQSPAEYAGYGWSKAVHPEDSEPTIAAWQLAVETRSVFSHEHRVRRSDGAWRNFAIQAVPILDDDNEIVEWVGVHTEITEQRAAEAALVALNHELEHRVETEVATRVNVENALRQSQKMDSLGHLTGGIAHDFNNMLSVIASAFSLLHRRLSDGDQTIVHFIEAGQDAAMRAAGLTKRMLAFARQQPLSPEIVDVNKLISELQQLLAHSIGKDVKIECRLEEGLWSTLIDANQLENAILNLAVNARDAMDGRGHLMIETRNVVSGDDVDLPDGIKPDAFILICVSDYGPGMTAEVRAKVFEPFFTTKPVGKGTGLGLSQVYGFVKQSDGNVEIVSAPGAGTRVELYFPRHQ